MRNLLRRFRADNAGNVAMLFGIASVPLIATAGLALDYTYMVRERTDLQNAIDSAVISLAKLPKTTSDGELTERARAFVTAYTPKGVLENVQVEAVRGESTIQIVAKADYPTTLTRALQLVTNSDVSKWTIDTSAQSTWGKGKVEVMLVLDNTGSMAGTKISQLKTAANSLIDTLAAQAVEADTVKIGLVPFSITVRLPTSYSSASWMDKTGISPINKEIFNGTANVNRFNLFTTLGTSWGGCVESRPAPYDVTDPSPSSATPGTLIVPFFAPDEYGNSNDQNTYPNNYMSDVLTSGTFQQRQGSVAKYTTTNKPFKTLSTSFGPNDGCSMKEIMPLTTNFTSLKTAVNSMVATGNTNIPLGLAWGWYGVSPNNMLSTNKPYDDLDTAKVIVLLSDGANDLPSQGTSNENRSIYTGIGYFWQGRLGTTSTTKATQDNAANNRLKLLCENINALKKPNDKHAVQIYTILVQVSNTTTKNLMQNCASDSSMYYDVSDASKLTEAFSNIAGQISKLHLSR